jgi:hypothetical protein
LEVRFPGESQRSDVVRDEAWHANCPCCPTAQRLSDPARCLVVGDLIIGLAALLCDDLATMEQKAELVNRVLKSFRCSICQSIASAIFRCGHMTCLSCIEQWWTTDPSKTGTCPECKAPVGRHSHSISAGAELQSFDAIVAPLLKLGSRLLSRAHSQFSFCSQLHSQNSTVVLQSASLHAMGSPTPIVEPSQPRMQNEASVIIVSDQTPLAEPSRKGSQLQGSQRRNRAHTADSAITHQQAAHPAGRFLASSNDVFDLPFSSQAAQASPDGRQLEARIGDTDEGGEGSNNSDVRQGRRFFPQEAQRLTETDLPSHVAGMLDFVDRGLQPSIQRLPALMLVLTSQSEVWRDLRRNRDLCEMFRTQLDYLIATFTFHPGRRLALVTGVPNVDGSLPQVEVARPPQWPEGYCSCPSVGADEHQRPCFVQYLEQVAGFLGYGIRDS